MKRVAYICCDPGVPIFGAKGCTVHVQEVIRAMRRAGCDVELFAMNVNGAPPADLVNVKVHHIPVQASQDVAAREVALHEANDVLRRALDAAGPFDLVYERHALWSVAAMEWAADRHCLGVLEVNAPLVEEQSLYRTLVNRAQAEVAAQRAFAAATAVVAVSSEVAAHACALVQPDRLFIVPNGVNVLRINPDVPPQFPAKSGQTTVGFIGTLKPWHGVEDLISAASDLDGVRLLIVGDGPLREQLEAKSARGANVIFTGAVEPRQVPGLLTSMDIAAAPYPNLKEFYFSPLKILEYMAAGRAIVASAIGQIAHTLRHEHNALLNAAGDVAALRSNIIRLRDDPSLRARLGSQARQDALAHHSWDAAVQRILAIAARGKTFARAGTEACA